MANDTFKSLKFSFHDKEGNSYPERTSKNGKTYIQAKIQGDFAGIARFYPDSGFYTVSLTPRQSVDDKIAQAVAEALKNR